MTVDPNDAEQGELPITQAESETQAAQVEAPAAAAPAVDVDTLADRVIEKLMTAAQTAAPETQTQAYTQGPGGNVLQTLHDQARDPNHPLYATAVAQLEMLRRQGEEEEWGALGIPPGHPARMMYAQNPAAFSNRPRHAHTAWELAESRRGQNDRAREQAAATAAAESERKAAEAVRASAPGMPSRSVGVKPGSGRVSMSHDEFERRVVNEPELDDLADKGLIDWKH